MGPTYAKSAVRWLLTIALLALVSIIVAILLLRQNVNRRRSAFEAEIARHQQLGEPAYLEDLRSANVESAQNPVNQWIEAIRAVTTDDDSPIYTLPYLDPPFLPADMNKARRLVDFNRGVFTTVRQAIVSREEPAWPISFGPPSDAFGGVRGNEIGRFHCLLATAALDAAYRGDDTIAFERLDQLNQFRIDTAHAAGLFAIVTSSEEMWLGTSERVFIHIANECASGRRAFPRERIRQLIQLLLDDATAKSIERRALLTDRILALNDLLGEAELSMSRAGFGAASSSGRLNSLLTQPQYFDRASRLAQIHAQVMQCFDAPDYTTAVAQSRQIPQLSGKTEQMVENFWIDFIALRYRRETRRHLAALAIAMEWYSVEHNGTFPVSLADLVPAYFRTIPTDSVAADRQFHYRNDGDPVVYSASFQPPGATQPTSMPSTELNRVDEDQVFLRPKQ